MRMATNNGADAISTTARPALVAIVHAACPRATPAAVAAPVVRSPARVLRIVRAVSWPGVQMTRRETPRNATYEPRPTGPELSAASRVAGRRRGRCGAGGRAPGVRA